MSERYDKAAEIIINSITAKDDNIESNGKRYVYYFPKSQEDVHKVIEAIKSAGVKDAEKHQSSMSKIPVVRVASPYVDPALGPITRTAREVNLIQLNLAIANAEIKERSKAKEKMNDREIDKLSNFYISKINKTYYLSMNDEHMDHLDIALNILKKYGLQPQQDGYRYKIFAPTIKIAGILEGIVEASQIKYKEKERAKEAEISRQAARPTVQKPNTEQQNKNGLFARIKAAFQEMLK